MTIEQLIGRILLAAKPCIRILSMLVASRSEVLVITPHTVCPVLFKVCFWNFRAHSGPLVRGGTVVVRPGDDKQPTLAYTNEGVSSLNSSQSVSKLPRSQTLNLIC